MGPPDAEGRASGPVDAKTGDFYDLFAMDGGTVTGIPRAAATMISLGDYALLVAPTGAAFSSACSSSPASSTSTSSSSSYSTYSSSSRRRSRLIARKPSASWPTIGPRASSRTTVVISSMTSA